MVDQQKRKGHTGQYKRVQKSMAVNEVQVFKYSGRHELPVSIAGSMKLEAVRLVHGSRTADCYQLGQTSAKQLLTFYWKEMSTHAAHYITTCFQCTVSKNRQEQ